MATALIMTAAGGMYLAQFPSYQGLQWLYGYWGFSTIFLFWSAMIKATRNWGGGKQQGRAFGYLEAGRGLVAASIGVVGVLLSYFQTILKRLLLKNAKRPSAMSSSLLLPLPV